MRHDGLISVNSGRNLIIVAPEQEFALGEVAERDEIVRAYAGDRLVGVRVMKAGEVGPESRRARERSVVGRPNGGLRCANPPYTLTTTARSRVSRRSRCATMD